MLLSAAELDLLRLTAWCKDIPAQSVFLDKDAAKTMLDLGYIRRAKCGDSYRPSRAGLELLQRAGYNYPQDKYPRGAGPIYTRRLQMANLILFFHRLGVDVFLHDPPRADGIQYLPSFALRRKAASNLLGGSRMAGFLYTPETVYVPYYLTENDDGIYPAEEERLIGTEALRRGRNPAVLFTGPDNLRGVWVAMQHSGRKSAAKSYGEALDAFRVPCMLLPLSMDGLAQLRIMLEPSYRPRLMMRILGKQYQPWDRIVDARHKQTGDAWFIGLDGDIKRMMAAACCSRDGPIHMLFLPYQMEVMAHRLQGLPVILHELSVPAAEAALDIEAGGLIPAPARTKEGAYIFVDWAAKKAGP